MTDLQACIGRVQLKKLPSFLNKRERIFNRYKNAGLNLIDDDAFEPVRYRAVVRTDHAEQDIKQLNDAGIKSIIPIEDWELLEQLPNSMYLSKHTISLPLYPTLSDSDVDNILRVLAS